MIEAGILTSDAAAHFAGWRVLLTGASGFLGGHMARQALAAGVELYELGRHAGVPGAAFHHADLTDAAAVADVVVRVRPQAVIHCAAPGVSYGTMDFAAMLGVAVGGTQALYDACARLAEPPAIVHLGSGFEYANSATAVSEDAPLVPSASLHGAAKAASSMVAGGYAADLRMALLRPFHLYGTGEAARRLGPMLIAKAVAGERVPLTAGEQQRDFLHVDDGANCIWLALAKVASGTPGLTVLNCGSGTAITLRHFIERLGAELRSAGFPADLVALGALPYRAHEPMVSLPDITRLLTTLDWRPRVSLEQGVADLVQRQLAR